MRRFKWFDTKDVDVLAKRMVDDMVKRIPPSNFGSGSQKSEARKGRTHDLVLREASEFAHNHRLNVYTKARLANNFKWALLDAGYPRDFVDMMTVELAAVVAGANRVPGEARHPEAASARRKRPRSSA
jgi:hypothetical protein